VTNDFIEVYEDALDAKICEALIRNFESSGLAVRGKTGGGVDTKLKDSWDICIDDYPQWRDAVNVLNSAMMRSLIAYVRKYPYTAIAPLSLRKPDPKTGELVSLDAEAISNLSDDQLQMLMVQVFRPGTINLQKYIANQGGYPYYHCELYPKIGDTTGETLHRVLLWSVYLNDAFAEGETEFFYQQRKVVPQTGSMVIAPAGFTHTHRGNMPKSGNKYIATSWILFQRAEHLFGDPSAAKR
jgi:hypothetical protein